MKAWIDRFRRRAERSTNGHAPRPEFPPADPAGVVQEILETEAESDPPIEPGKLVHRSEYAGLELRLDRDLFGHYRVTVNEGAKRKYSFTLRCARGDAEALHAAYAEIFRFLEGERRIADLPRTEHLVGHFYGE